MGGGGGGGGEGKSNLEPSRFSDDTFKIGLNRLLLASPALMREPLFDDDEDDKASEDEGLSMVVVVVADAAAVPRSAARSSALTVPESYLSSDPSTLRSSSRSCSPDIFF